MDAPYENLNNWQDPDDGDIVDSFLIWLLELLGDA